jgi:hypothetical protein
MPDHYRDLLLAAAEAFNKVFTQYEASRPEDAAAFATLHKKSGAVPFLLITLAPRLGLQFGFEHAGTPNIIHQLNVLPDDASLPQ